MKFTAVSRRLHLYLSPRKMLSSPTEASKRLRGAIRCGFLSLFPVLGAGMLTRVELYSDAGQGVGSGVVGVALTAVAHQPCLKLLVGGQAAQIDSRLPVRKRRGERIAWGVWINGR